MANESRMRLHRSERSRSFACLLTLSSTVYCVSSRWTEEGGLFVRTGERPKQKASGVQARQGRGRRGGTARKQDSYTLSGPYSSSSSSYLFLALRSPYKAGHYTHTH